jgi:tetratricopeptide (TPR) repeat protein
MATMQSATNRGHVPHPTRRIVALLGLVIAASYANTLSIDFQLDDHHVVESNPHIRRLANVPRFFVDPNLSSVNHQSKLFRPVLTTTYAVNYAVSGLNTWSYHLFNILLHWLAVVLVFRIARDHLWLDDAALPVALAAALVVAVHPLNSEPVDYISSRSAGLATVLYLGAFDAALRARRGACAVLFVLGLLTKAIVFTLPVVLAGYFAIARVAAPAAARPRMPWSLMAGLTVLAAAFGLYHQWVSPAHMSAAMGEPGVSPWMYFMTGWSAYLYYLRLVAWPDALVIDRKDYPIVESLAEPQAWLSLLALILIGRLAWSARRRYPALTFAAFWYFVTLAPESTFFPLAEPVNEHRPYLAMLGVGTAAGIGLWLLTRRFADRYQLSAAWLFAVCLTFTATAFGATTIVRNQTWQDPYALWSDATRKAPRNPRAWLNVGHAELGRGDYAAARRHLLKARELAPCYHYVLVNLSVLEARVSDLERSLAWADDAVRCGPDLPLTHRYRGLALERLGRLGDALAAQRRATAIDPYDVDAWFAQGRLLEAQQAWREAVGAYRQAWALDPTHSTAAMSIGLLYHYRLGLPADALPYYAAVLRIVPGHYGAHFQLALAHHAAGNRRAAARAWRRFLPLAEAIGDAASIASGASRLGDAALERRPAPTETASAEG